MRWDGERFVEHQVLDGDGAREFAVVQSADSLYVVRVNFIHGTPADPTTALKSQLYRWQNAELAVVEEFDTFGGTDAAVIVDGDGHTRRRFELTHARHPLLDRHGRLPLQRVTIRRVLPKQKEIERGCVRKP